MRDALIIFALCLVAIIIGGWLFFYAPAGLALFPLGNYQPSAYVQPATAKDVPFTEVASGTQSKLTASRNYVVHAADAFATLWAQLGQKPPPPKVDFSKDEVISVFAGKEPTGGYSIKVDKITDTDTARVISIILTKPGAGCVNSQLVTSPFDVVTASASTLTPVREEHIVLVNCK